MTGRKGVCGKPRKGFPRHSNPKFSKLSWSFENLLRLSNILFDSLRRASPVFTQKPSQGQAFRDSYFFSGMANRNRVDAESLSARRVPLCSWAITAAMLSPRPEPLFSPREASAR